MSKFIDELPTKNNITGNDKFVISDSADSNNNKQVSATTMATFFGGGSGETSASIAAIINNSQEANPLTDNDKFALSSGNSSEMKYLAFSRLKAIVKAYFDGVYASKDATTANIADSANKRYVTDAEKTLLSNTSGSNTGDESNDSIGAMIANSDTLTDLNDNDLFGVSYTGDNGCLWGISYADLKANIQNKVTLGTLINNLSPLYTPVDNDEFPVMNSADSNKLYKMSWYHINSKIKSIQNTITNDTIDYTNTFVNNRFKVVNGTTNMYGTTVTVNGILECVLPSSNLSYGYQLLATSTALYIRLINRIGDGTVYNWGQWRPLLDLNSTNINSHGFETLPTLSNNELVISMTGYFKYYFRNTYYDLVTSRTFSIDLGSTMYKDNNATTDFVDNKLFYVYYKSTGTVAVLYWSDVRSDPLTTMPVCALMRTGSIYALFDMREMYNSNKYYPTDKSIEISSGGNLTAPAIGGNGSTLTITDITMYNKDTKIDIATSLMTSALLAVESSANTYSFPSSTVSKAYYCINDATLKYNNNYTATDVATNSYANYYFYLSTNVIKPIIMIPGKISSTDLGTVLAENIPDIENSNLPKNMKPLYRLTYYRDSGINYSVVNIQDYRYLTSLNGLIKKPIISLSEYNKFLSLDSTVNFASVTYLDIMSFTLEPGLYKIDGVFLFRRNSTTAQSRSVRLVDLASTTQGKVEGYSYQTSVSGAYSQIYLSGLLNVISSSTQYTFRCTTTTNDSSSTIEGKGSSGYKTFATITKLN